MATCGSCGQQNREGARFCDACGADLTFAVAAGEVRKTVTVVFCDLAGSTALGERLDPESLRGVMTRYFESMRAALERHGGTVEKFIGDAIVAVFGVPRIHEDDALRAVRATAEMREGLRQLNEEIERDYGTTLACRIGVNTGEVMAGDATSGQALVTGDAGNVAARLEQAAGPGEILIGVATYRLVRAAVVAEPVEPLELKGKAEPVRAYRLVEIIPDAPPRAPRLRSPMVGRDPQLGHLVGTLDAAVTEARCHLVTVLGDPGVGKSRLVEELSSAVGDRARILHGRCLPYGEGITYFAAVEVLKQAVGLHDFDAAEEAARAIGAAVEGEEHADLLSSRLSQLLGLPGAQAMPQETFWAIRRLLEAVARKGPLVVVLEDLHWAEPTFLDLVEHIADWSREAPILLLCTARPELLDERPGWAVGKQNATTLPLKALGEQDAERLAENLLGSTDLGTDLPARIASAAEGNPLFVEEMLWMLIDGGLLVRRDHTWVATSDLSSVPVPPSIQAVLAARLALLGPTERRTIERASVVGKEFFLGAIAALSPEGTRAMASRDVAALVRRDLITPDRSTLPGEEACRFRHMLIRDTAYEGIPKAIRAELHEAFATWLEQVAGERIAEQEEVAGYHLERAFAYRRELGPIDEVGRELGRRAATRLAAAGGRAFDRDDMPSAADLLGRAVSLLGEDDPARLELLPNLADARWWMGELDASKATLEEAIERARASGDRRIEWHALVRLAQVASLIDPSGYTTERMRRDAEEAIGVFEEIGDEAGLASAWLLLADVAWTKCRYSDVSEAGKHAMEHARRAERPREQANGLFMASTGLTWGPAPVPEAIRWYEESLRSVGSIDGARLEGMHLNLLLAMQGRFDEARALFEGWRAVLEDAGWESALASSWWNRARIEALAGNEEAAEADLRAAYVALEAQGDASHLSTCAADLAEVVYRQGGYDEAYGLTEVSERSGAPDDMSTQVEWREVRAKVLARRDDLGAGERLAREAVSMAETTDDLNLQGNALMDLAEVLGLADRRAEVAAAATEALALYEKKGNLVAAERARALLAELI